MKIKLFLIVNLFAILLLSCKANRKEIFISEGCNFSPIPTNLSFTIYEDSAYSYKYLGERPDPNNEYLFHLDTIIEETGKAIINKDSIYLIEHEWNGLLKNGFVEFYKDNNTFSRQKIIKTSLDVNNTFDYKKHPKIHQISLYKYDYIVLEDEIPFTKIDLNESEILRLEEIIYKGFESDPMLEDLDYDTYFIQIYPILNSSGEKIVYCNLSCEEFSVWSHFMQVDDGGSCFMEMKVNLSSQKIYELMINGV
ncbi:hypothetical protein LJC52_04450 [Bacteroidales bacterium OttesenSCG-928-A17]|nr:hypothetical protein [Bacteroidales bacterium OttesenSCG-928-A17]